MLTDKLLLLTLRTQASKIFHVMFNNSYKKNWDDIGIMLRERKKNHRENLKNF